MTQKIYYLTLLVFLFSGTSYASKKSEIPTTSAVDKVPPTSTHEGDKKKAIRPASSHGQRLYEIHCLSCHESNVHIRNNRKARNIDDVKSWVVKWQTYQEYNWDEEAINAVTEYLVNTWYKF